MVRIYRFYLSQTEKLNISKCCAKIYSVAEYFIFSKKYVGNGIWFDIANGKLLKLQVPISKVRFICRLLNYFKASTKCVIAIYDTSVKSAILRKKVYDILCNKKEISRQVIIKITKHS